MNLLNNLVLFWRTLVLGMFIKMCHSTNSLSAMITFKLLLFDIYSKVGEPHCELMTPGDYLAYSLILGLLGAFRRLDS